MTTPSSAAAPTPSTPNARARSAAHLVGQVPMPTTAQVASLQAIRGYPCISVLMNTTPAAAMTSADAAALRRLSAQAARRLDRDVPPQTQALAVQLLTTAVEEAVDGPTADSIAVFADLDTSQVCRLPVPVRNRVVIDPSFATRDLVRALHRTPRHTVLILTAKEARLLTGAGGVLQPAARSAFPLRAGDGSGREPDPGGRRGPARTDRKEAETTAFLRSVDRALGAHLAVSPAPLVLVGPERIVAAFRGLSRNLSRLAGAITGGHAGAPLPELVVRIRPVLADYLRSRQEEAVALLERRTGANRTVHGLQAAWLAARHERPEMLMVEEGLYCPVRLSADGDLLTPADDVEHPDVIDDAVDELIEQVLARGGWVALAEDGSLSAQQGVALTLRGPR